MNARRIPSAKARAEAQAVPIKPIAITLSCDPGIVAAANADRAADDGDDRSVNPLWMISVALAAFFAFLALVATFN